MNTCMYVCTHHRSDLHAWAYPACMNACIHIYNSPDSFKTLHTYIHAYIHAYTYKHTYLTHLTSSKHCASLKSTICKQPRHKMISINKTQNKFTLLYICVCMRVWVCVYIYILCVCIYIYIYILLICNNIHKRTYIHTPIHPYIHTHTHAHTLPDPSEILCISCKIPKFW